MTVVEGGLRVVHIAVSYFANLLSGFKIKLMAHMR